jgi:predicted nucleic acid-binding protein
MLKPTEIDTNRIILDTDVISYLFNEKPQAEFFYPYLLNKSLSVSFITIAELFHGVIKDKWGDRRIAALKGFLVDFVILEYQYDLCLRWAEIKSNCELRGYPIEDSDCWIAACAKHYNCVLATNNARHFIHVRGLKLITPNPN